MQLVNAISTLTTELANEKKKCQELELQYKAVDSAAINELRRKALESEENRKSAEEEVQKWKAKCEDMQKAMEDVFNRFGG